MKNEKMMKYIEQTLKLAKDLGVKDCDVVATDSDNFSLKCEKGELSEYKKSSSTSLGVRIIKDSKVGISFTEALDEDSIKLTIENAINNSKFSKVDIHQKISSSNIEISDFNPKANCEHSPSVEEMIEKAHFLEDEVYAREKLATNAPYNGVNEATGITCLGNSKGVRCSYSAKSYSCYTSALLKDGEKSSMHFASNTSRDFKTLDFDKCINESITDAKNLLHATQLKTGDYDVTFTPDIFEDVFHSFSLMLSAKGAIDKVNPWKDKINQEVVDKKLNFIDDPFFEEGFMTIPFDGEGYKKQRNQFVENGVLKNFIHNSATASELNMENNFCASRSPKSPLATRLSNFIIGAGPDDENQLKKMNYVEITKAQGLHSGVNSVSGEFSLGVSGRLYENGVVTRYFKDVTVSGNFYKILKDIKFVGNVVHPASSRSFFTPTIIFNGLSIAGL